MREAMKDYVANNRESTADDRQLTRRRLAAGVAWSVPAVLATTAVPAYAASACPEITATVGQTQNSVGESIVTVVFTADKKWGDANVTVNGGDWLNPGDAGFTDSLTVQARVDETYQVVLEVTGCEPVTVGACELTIRQ